MEDRTYLDLAVSEFPGPIARSVEKILLPSNEKRKHEFIRLAFEITLSFIASVELVNYVRTTRSEKSPDEQINKLIQDCGTEMTLGKWASILQSIAKNYSKKLFFKELGALYSSKSNEFLSGVDFLIRERNSDAHGTPIPDDKYDEIIAKRQDALSDVFKALSFLKNFDLICPVAARVLESGIEYTVNHQRGTQSTITNGMYSDVDIQINFAYLIPSDGASKVFNTHPFIVAFRNPDNDRIRMGVFSRSAGAQMGIKFIGSDGAWEVNESGSSSRPELIKEYRSLLEWVGIVDRKRPAVSVVRHFPKDVYQMKKGVAEDIRGVLRISNNGEIEAGNVTVRFPLPPGFSDMESGNNEIACVIESLPVAKKPREVPFLIKSVNAGQAPLADGFVKYTYLSEATDDESPEDGREENVEEVELSILSNEVITIKDPESKDPIRPLLTVSITIDKNPIRLGESFSTNIRIANVGIARAQNIQFRMIAPESLKLIGGAINYAGMLNPGEKENITAVFQAVRHGIVELICTDITYSDGENNFFVCDDPGRVPIFISHNEKDEIKLHLKEIWEDMGLDQDEREAMKKLRSHALEKKLFSEEEFDSFIRNLKIENLQSIIEEPARRSGNEIVSRPIKNAIAFELGGLNLPFALIDVSDKEHLYLWLACEFDKKQVENAPHMDVLLCPFGFRNYPLNTRIDINMMAETQKAGRSVSSILTGWIEKSINHMIEYMHPLKSSAETIVGAAWNKFSPAPGVQYDYNGIEIYFHVNEKAMEYTGLRCLYFILDNKDKSKLHFLSYPGTIQGLKYYLKDWWDIKAEDFLRNASPIPTGADVGGYQIETAARGGFFIAESGILFEDFPKLVQKKIARAINQIQLFKAFSWIDKWDLKESEDYTKEHAKRALIDILLSDTDIVITCNEWGINFFPGLSAFSSKSNDKESVEPIHIGSDKKAYFRFTDKALLPESIVKDDALNDYHYLSRMWTHEKRIESFKDFEWIKDYTLCSVETIRMKSEAEWSKKAIEILLQGPLKGHLAYHHILKYLADLPDDSYVSVEEMELALRTSNPDIFTEKKVTKGERRYFSRACNQPCRRQFIEYDYSEWPVVKIRLAPELKSWFGELVATII